MLKIKLTRLGKKAEPRYRIVVNECRDKRDGKVVDTLGFYQPAESPKKIELDVALFETWLKKGAQPTSTVAFLYDVVKKGKGFPEGKPKLSKKAKAKLAAAKAEADSKTEPAPEAAPTPAPEAQAEEKA